MNMYVYWDTVGASNQLAHNNRSIPTPIDTQDEPQEKIMVKNLLEGNCIAIELF